MDRILSTAGSVIILVMSLALGGCFTFRRADRVMIKRFDKGGIVLDTATMRINDRALHYVSVGADTLPTVVFVHGSPGGWKEFERYLKDTTLSARFRLISIDRPGFGYSNYGKALNLQQQADQIRTLLFALQNGKPLYLVGHSLGGPLVALLAADNPRLVSSIVIMAGALDPALEAKEKWRRTFMKPPFRYLLPGAARQSNVELWYLKKDLVALQEKLPHITCPVHVMHAENDILVDIKNADYIKRTFTGATVSEHIYDRGNHLIHFNKQQELTTILFSMQTK